MHPTIAYEITRARIADRHRQAERAELIHATRQAHSGSTPPRPRPAAALARRLAALLAAHGQFVHTPAQPVPACSPSAACTDCA